MSCVRYVAGVASVGHCVHVVAANMGAILLVTDLINEADDKNVVEPGVHSSCKRDELYNNALCWVTMCGQSFQELWDGVHYRSSYVGMESMLH